MPDKFAVYREDDAYFNYLVTKIDRCVWRFIHARFVSLQDELSSTDTNPTHILISVKQEKERERGNGIALINGGVSS